MTPVSQTFRFISRFLITDSAAPADLCVGFPFSGTEVMIQDMAVRTFKDLCHSHSVVEGISTQETVKEDPLLHSKG